jgi:CheY-like chemotaxis protein
MILIIEDDATIGPALRRLTARAFPEQLVRLANNGLAGVELASQHATELDLIVLDINMPLLDGRPVAAELRALAPRVPIMPFTGDETRLPVLTALGCVHPVIKGKVELRDVPRQMRLAMNATVMPLDENEWISTLRQSAQTVLDFARAMSLGMAPAPHSEIGMSRERAERIIAKLARVKERMPSRELDQAIRELQEEL